MCVGFFCSSPLVADGLEVLLLLMPSGSTLLFSPSDGVLLYFGAVALKRSLCNYLSIDLTGRKSIISLTRKCSNSTELLSSDQQPNRIPPPPFFFFQVNSTLPANCGCVSLLLLLFISIPKTDQEKRTVEECQYTCEPGFQYHY